MIADIIIIAIMGLCVFFGYSRGLIKVGVRILSFVISLVIALVLYTPISNYIIENTDIFITGDTDFLDVDIEMPEIMMPGEFLEKVIKNS